MYSSVLRSLNKSELANERGSWELGVTSVERFLSKIGEYEFFIDFDKTLAVLLQRKFEVRNQLWLLAPRDRKIGLHFYLFRTSPFEPGTPQTN